ncbi:dynein light chain Tctex-type 5-B-like isoform X2 [Lineus longissimus]
MTHLNLPDQSQGARRSSLFQIPINFKPAPRGSSHVSFIRDPHHDDTLHEDSFHRRPKKVYYENTYQMDPPERFKAEQVSDIIREVLNSSLEETTYEPMACSILSKTIAQDIKLRVEELDFKRYKLISWVTIGEKKDQGVRIGSRCVWDQDRDNFATATFENTHIYAVGMMYAVYYE